MFSFRSQSRRPVQKSAPVSPQVKPQKASFAISKYELEIAEFCTWAANQTGFGCPSSKGNSATYIQTMLKKYPREQRIRYWASRLGVRQAQA